MTKASSQKQLIWWLVNKVVTGGWLVMTFSIVIASGIVLPEACRLLGQCQFRGRSWICFNSCPVQYFDQRPGSEDPEDMLIK